MLKSIVAAVTISLAIGAAPAVAQNFKGSCSAYCAQKTCVMSSSKNLCMSRCVPKCRQRNPHSKP